MYQALSDCIKAININPDLANAYYNRGNVHANQGDFHEAISDYTRAIEIDPDYVQAYNNRAMIYYKLGQNDESWADVHKVEELKSSVLPEFLQLLKRVSGREK